MSERVVQIYPLFERFWHWAQVLLILVMAFTGLRIYGVHEWMGFQQAINLHEIAAVALMILWVFAIFWHLTTGTWKHYVPTTNGLWKVMRYYSFGIFRGERHPYRKAFWRKHNPLQAMAYLALKLVLFPLIWVTGLVYLAYGLWEASPDAGFWLMVVSNLHVLAAFGIIAFLIVHIYLMTTGDHSVWAHIKPMFTGYDHVDLSDAEEAYLEADEPGRIKPVA